MRHDIRAEYIVDELMSHGYNAYIIGGTLRDLIMDRIPEKWEIGVEAYTDEIYNILNLMGITAIRSIDGTTINVIASESELGIGNDTETKIYTLKTYKTGEIKKSLYTRDFTMNALAFNYRDGIIDYCGGHRDIDDKVIRSNGDPKIKISARPIRILRAIRFQYKLNFEIESHTLSAINSLVTSNALGSLSQSAKQQELTKLIIIDNVEDLLCRYSNIIISIIPELISCYNFYYKVEDKSISLYKHMAKTAGVFNLKGTVDYRDRIAAFLHDIAKPVTYKDNFKGHEEIGALMAADILSRLEFSSFDINYITKLIKYHSIEIHDKKEFKTIINQVGVNDFYKILELRHADIVANCSCNIDKEIQNLVTIRKWLNEYSGSVIDFTVHDLKIGGKDLIALGMKPGENFGIILNKLMDLVLLGQLSNDREKLVDYVKNRYLMP